MKHILSFAYATGMKYMEGEIGFGRKCVGIINPATDSYIAYQVYDWEEWKEVYRHDTAMGAAPYDAYHKGPYLAVLHDGSEEGLRRAIEQLDAWIEKIVAAGYEMKEYEEKDSVAALFAGKKSITQKVLTGGISFGKLTEIF